METIAGIVVFNPLVRKFLILQNDFGYDLPKGQTGLQPALVPDWYVFLQKGKKNYHFYLGVVQDTPVSLSAEHNNALWAGESIVDQLKRPLNVVVLAVAENPIK